jgi:septal ring-binding cell division protein DamX
MPVQRLERLPMNEIFISYRRSDSAAFTNQVYTRLAAEFGEDAVFKDVDKIAIGEDFRAAIEQALINCKVMLVIIGSEWSDAQDEQGERRLDNPADFVRLEVEMGLRHKAIRVIPVLIQGAAMPDPNNLPPSLYNLAYNNAATVRAEPNFDQDMARLTAGLRTVIAPRPARRVNIMTLAITSIALIALLVVIYLSQRDGVFLQSLTETAIVLAQTENPTATSTPPETSTAAPSPTPSLTPTRTETPTETPTQPSAQNWAIIFSNDASLDEAQFEVNRALNLGYRETTLYRTASWYVTVIQHFATQEEAAESLSLDEALKQNRPNAYVDDLNRLCPTQTIKEDFVDCR